jgi:uncharacterized membrane protein YhaH (DUF805 family)
MSFGQAVSDGFSQYATFSGRSRRSAYWYWVLFVFLGSVVASLLDNLLGITIEGASVAGNDSVGWISLLFAFAVIIPSLAVTFRRLHDTGRSGWWWLFALLCCIGQIIVFIFCLSDSTPGDNEYGPNPKGA